jgi:hypothetical protein
MNYQRVKKYMHDAEYGIRDLALNGTSMVINTGGDTIKFRQFATMIWELSEGRNEVTLDALGRPYIWVCEYPNNMARQEWLSMGGTLFTPENSFALHPAFIINGSVARVIRHGKYNAVKVAGVNYPCSLPGLPAADSISFDAIDTLCTAAGGTIHNETRCEYWYRVMKGARMSYFPDGNNYYGVDYKDHNRAGCACNYDTVNNRTTYTMTDAEIERFSDDGTIFGRFGQNGNKVRLLRGLRFLSGEPNVFQFNNAADPSVAELLDSTGWKAIKADNTFCDVGDTQSLKYDYKSAHDEGATSQPFEVTDTLVNQQTDEASYMASAFSAITAHTGITIPAKMILYGLYPLLSNNPAGSFYVRNYSGMERIGGAGGYYGDTSGAGVGCLSGSFSRGFAYTNGGFSPASYEIGDSPRETVNW